MPKGPNGQKRPADIIGASILVAKIATGEVQESLQEPKDVSAAKAKGGNARAQKLTPERRSEIAREAVKKRWSKPG